MTVSTPSFPHVMPCKYIFYDCLTTYFIQLKRMQRGTSGENLRDKLIAETGLFVKIPVAVVCERSL